MSFQLKKADPLDLAQYKPMTKPDPGFEANYEAARRAFALNDTSTSEAKALYEVWQPIIDDMNSRSTGQTFYNPSIAYRTSIFNETKQEQDYSANLNRIFREIDQNDAFADLRGKFTRESLFEQAAQLARDSKEELAKVRSNSFTTKSTIGSGLGTFNALINDPVLAGSMLLGTSNQLWKMALGEMVIGAGSEVLIQQKVKDWYQSTNQKYTDEQFWNAVLLGGAAGFATPFVFRGIGKGVQTGSQAFSFTNQQIQKGLSVLRKAGAKQTPEGKRLEDLADDAEAIEKSNPLQDTPGPQSQHEHQLRLEQATEAVERGGEPAMSNQPAVPPKVLTPDEIDNLDGVMYRFNPADLKVDAKLFQFKEGGDEFGVLPESKVANVTEWNPALSGRVVVWEALDGTRYIVDGHQRMGLARRIAANNPEKAAEIKLYGELMREADGKTASDARVHAALKNITEGTGNAFDVARIIDEAPDKIGVVPEPSALVRDARGLVLLSDDLILATKNEVLDVSQAAIVGRLIPDDADLQRAAYDVLVKTQPPSLQQAELIVRQVMAAGFEKRTQTTLFGDEVIAESFFAERAKILSQAIRLLRNDKNAFSSLIRNKGRLEEEGNQLAVDANKRRLEDDKKAIALVEALANTKGPLSDALTAAARTARDTGKFTKPTEGFVEAIRRGIADGDFERIAVGDPGRIVDDTQTGGPSRNEPTEDIKQFDSPGGVGAQRQADQLQNDIETDLEAERLGDVNLDDEPRLYFDLTEDSYLVPVNMIIPTRAREQGILRSKQFMKQAAQGLMNKRKPLSVIPNEDGTFTLADGNSTYAVAVDQGFNSLPVRVMSREQFASEEATKAAEKIAILDDKKKARVLRVEDLGDYTDPTQQGIKSSTFSKFDDLFRHKQNYKSVQDIIERATPRQEQLNKDVAEFAVKENEGKELLEDKILYLEGKVKSEKRLTEKIRDEYDGDADLIIDSARSLFVLPKPEDVEKLIKFFLSKDYHVIWKGWGKKGEYTDGKMTLQKLDSTELMEVQVHNVHMLLAKEDQDVIDLLRFNDTDEGFANLKGALGGHDLYKISRDYLRSETERLEAAAKMDEIYGEALSKASAEASWARLISSLDTSAPAASARNMKSASDISGDQLSLNKFMESSEYQRPLRPDQATARLPSEETAAGVLPSKEKNLIDEPPKETITDIASESKPTDAAMRAELFRVIDEDRNQIPIGLTEEGTARTITRGQLLDEIKQDNKMLDRLRDCAQ